MGVDVKDVSATTFGYVIAYLLPGLIGLYALSLWYSPLDTVFKTFIAAESSATVFLLVLLASVFVGVELMAFRWVLFDCLYCRKDCLSSDEFSKLRGQEMLQAFQVPVDQHYRYHQFWGGLVFVFPVLFAGVGQRADLSLWSPSWWVMVIVALLVEGITFLAAAHAYNSYVARARAILRGG